MTPVELFDVAQCSVFPDARQVYSISDSTRLVLAQRLGDTLYIGFGPTLGALTGEDWLRNLNTVHKASTGGLRSHRGFREEFDTFGPDLHRVIKAEAPEYISLAGYSQGGPHAEDLASELAEEYGPRLSIDTFDAPRNWGWVSSAKVRTLFRRRGVRYRRWVVEGSPVHDLPPWWFWYAHTDKPIVIGADWDGPPWVGRHRAEVIKAELEKLEASWR